MVLGGIVLFSIFVKKGVAYGKSMCYYIFRRQTSVFSTKTCGENGGNRNTWVKRPNIMW